MIGIVGGVGPLAGTDLFRHITEQTRANSDQKHLPILMFSLPHLIKDRTEYLERKVKENPGIIIAKICLDLARAGATIAAITCNTAHAPEIFNCITQELEKSKCSLKLVHIIVETIDQIKRVLPAGSKIGILSTTGVY